MQAEHERAIDVAREHAPAASFWRGDVRTCLLWPGQNFNLVDDSEPNSPKTVGQFRAVTLTAAPEGYVAVLAVQSTAVPSQLPTVLLSHTIKCGRFMPRVSG